MEFFLAFLLLLVRSTELGIPDAESERDLQGTVVELGGVETEPSRPPPIGLELEEATRSGWE